MIHLKGGENYITLKLVDKASGPYPYFTFKLLRKGTFDEIIFTSDDLSPVPFYWNRFKIEVDPVIGLTAGKIYPSDGEWTYEVHEMTTPYNLSLIQSVSLVDTGICIVDVVGVTVSTYLGPVDKGVSYYKK